MDFRKARARQPEILRSVQKDANYSRELASDFSDILRLTGRSNWIKYNQLCEQLAALSYHGFAAVNNLQTLGEEYTGIIQVSGDFKHIPSRWLQFYALLLEFAGDTLYLRILEKIQNYIEAHETLPNETKQQLFKVLACLKATPPYLKTLHKSMFYLHSDKYQISKRIANINYVLVRHWLKPNFAMYGYKILGLLTFLQVTLTLSIKSWGIWREQKLKAKKTPVSKSQHVSSIKCILCLEACHDISLTPCGHSFCWDCILDWLDEREECPLCRESLQKSRVVLLQNYI